MSERDAVAIKKLTDKLDQELVALVSRWATELGETDLTATFMRHSVMMALHIETDRVSFMRVVNEMWRFYSEAKKLQDAQRTVQ
jgi:ABC-type arginine transport system ATPase subunit